MHQIYSDNDSYRLCLSSSFDAYLAYQQSAETRIPNHLYARIALSAFCAAVSLSAAHADDLQVISDVNESGMFTIANSLSYAPFEYIDAIGQPIRRRRYRSDRQVTPFGRALARDLSVPPATSADHEGGRIPRNHQ